jgi:hypothetical protein
MSDEDRGIPVINKNVSYQVFLDTFLRPLKPCIVSGLQDDWSAAKEWTTWDSSTNNLIPNFSTLKDVFGEYQCCVTFCDETDSNGDTIQQEMPVSQFIDDIHQKDFITSTRKRYLKDFHFMRVNASLKSPYSVPNFFQGSSLVFHLT